MTAPVDVRETEVAPPEALAERMRSALGTPDGNPSGGRRDPGAYLAAAEAVLARLLANGATGTRSREAALDLLAADALVTYAFEAASATPDAIPPLARAAIARLTDGRDDRASD